MATVYSKWPFCWEKLHRLSLEYKGQVPVCLQCMRSPLFAFHLYNQCFHYTFTAFASRSPILSRSKAHSPCFVLLKSFCHHRNRSFRLWFWGAVTLSSIFRFSISLFKTTAASLKVPLSTLLATSYEQTEAEGVTTSLRVAKLEFRRRTEW